MSNSHQQSLDEEAVFLPVTEACPEFLHCEGERLAVEQLMTAGPGAFYAYLGAEKLGSFLSQEEVNQISGWAQDYTASRTRVGVPDSEGGGGREGEEEKNNGEENGEDRGSSEAWCLSSCYFPTHSDAPAPCLDLGWPERSSWPGRDCIQVCTSPPEEGQPPIREIVRRRLQQATQVIAIVTDRLTDNAVIGDLHSAASRGVPVYIILNQRCTLEDYTHNKLRHPHMQVRVLGGKTFCSREGRMVVGQMKDNYIMVDLETVIHGSYSLTWTDAHLHRQLVTVLSGPVVGSFDREFRILFAASLPVPEVRAAPFSSAGDAAHYRLNEASDLWYPNRPPLEPLLSPPPPPPVDSPLDWEALGVFRRNSYCSDDGPCRDPPPEEVTAAGRPSKNFVPIEKQPPVREEVSQNAHKLTLEKSGRQRDKPTPGANNVRDMQSQSNTLFSMTEDFNSGSAEITQRFVPKTERVYNRHPFKDVIKDMSDRTMFTHAEHSKEATLQHDLGLYSSNHRQDHTRTREALQEEQVDIDELSSRAEKQPSSRVRHCLLLFYFNFGLLVLYCLDIFWIRTKDYRAEQDGSQAGKYVDNSEKPLILRLPQNDNFSSLSDIMRRMQPQIPSPQKARGSQLAMSDLSRSMMDLSSEPTQDWGSAVPRLQGNFFDPGRMTPANTLMRKRNDEVKPLTGHYRTPNIYQPTTRPRSTSFGVLMDWRRPTGDKDADTKN